MKIAAIVTEYNPFHNGHKYQIEQVKALTGCDHVIIIMSGDFVQRGTPAFFDKSLRTNVALQNGADLVIELPVIWSLSSAEGFSFGAIEILNALNCVDFLCFGAENAKSDIFMVLAKLFADEPSEYRALLSDHLRKGLSYPVSRSNAAIQFITKYPEYFPSLSGYDSSYLKAFLNSPNNILGIEYSKALYKIGSNIKPLSLPRRGTGYHEQAGNKTFASASYIRNLILKSSGKWKDYVPKNCNSLYEEAISQNNILTENDYSSALLYQLTLNRHQGYTKYQDVTLELSNRIQNHLAAYQNFSDFAALLNTKEITHTRINRILMHILLGHSQKLLDDAKNPDAFYARILGWNTNAPDLLSRIHRCSQIPVITSLSQSYNNLTPAVQQILDMDILARDLYLYGLQNKNHALTLLPEYQLTPVKFK